MLKPQETMPKKANQREGLSCYFQDMQDKLKNEKKEPLTQYFEERLGELLNCLEKKNVPLRNCNLKILEELKSVDFADLSEDEKKSTMLKLEGAIDEIKEFSKLVFQIDKICQFLTKRQNEIAMVSGDIQQDKLKDNLGAILKNLPEIVKKIRTSDVTVAKNSNLRDRVVNFDMEVLAFLRRLLEGKYQDRDKYDQRVNQIISDSGQFRSYLKKAFSDEDFLVSELSRGDVMSYK